MRSKPADTKRWLLDIQHNIRLATAFVEGFDYDRFVADARAFYAARRCPEIVSEASRRLPPELKARYPNLPWTQIAAAGNVYRHDYEDVEPAFVWQAVTRRLPELLAVVEKELRQLP